MDTADSTASGLGSASPLLWRSARTCTNKVKISDSQSVTLEELHQELMLFLKKTKTIPRENLNFYLQQVKKMLPKDHKNRWLHMKIKGLLNFILKKRSTFQQSVARGEITIYEKSILAQPSYANFPGPPIDTCNSMMGTPTRFLSNQNFLSNDTCMEKYGSYSQDLFGDTAENIYNFAQENYQMFENLTQKIDPDDQTFKMPAAVVSKVRETHDTLEEDYKSSFSETPQCKIESVADDSDKLKCVNIFEDILISDQELWNEFEQTLEHTQAWMLEMICNLTRSELQKDDSHNVTMENNKNYLNENFSESNSLIRTYHSEENFKIIKETCAKYREELTKTNSLEYLENLLNNVDLGTRM